MLKQDEFARNVPEALKEKSRWVAWGPDPKTARPKCPLIISASDRRASTRKPETWQSWKHALAFYGKYAKGKDVGVGFVFDKDDGLIYVDVDDALDEKGELREWARPYVEPFISRAYIETSPGGRGLHIIGRGTLEGGMAGGKTNFPQFATGSKVPEVAIFAHGKYTTITGLIWKAHGQLGEVSDAVKLVWERAGIHAVSAGTLGGPPPDLGDLVTVDQRRVPKSVREELQLCKTANLEDRSEGRFKLYCEAAQKMKAEEIYALVVSSESWYEQSGAAAKGAEHTWQDICRAVAKADTAAKEFADLAEAAAEQNEEAATAWKELGISVNTEMTKSGPVHRAVYSTANMSKVLAKHPALAGKLRLNKFKEVVELEGVPVVDTDLVHLAEFIRAYLQWDREPQFDLVWRAVYHAALDAAYHPVQDYLNALEWDRVSRVDNWLVDSGCENTPATRIIGRKWLISLVARALDPGCKVDTVLILEGEQGRKKSMFLRTIAGGRNFFTDAHVTFDRDGQMLMHGNWVIELAELATLKKAELEKTKQFISSPELTFRSPYGRTIITRLRHFVLVGSTNDEEYLTDHSGARRYWPVRVTEKLDVKWLEANRDQLLAEAVALFEAGEPWWFDEQPAELVQAQEDRYAGDVLEGPIARFIDENPSLAFEMSSLLEALGFSVDRRDLAQRCGIVLRRLGYAKRKTRVGGKAPRWLWYDPVFDDGSGAPAADVVSLTSRDGSGSARSNGS